jgi:dimethylargininase
LPAIDPTMPNNTHRFTRAIVRSPADSALHGLRAVDRGAPDLARMRAAHAHYVATLEEAGLAVTLLPPLEAHPDSVFVEDTALCLPEGAILLRPGAASRAGEVAAMAPALRACFATVRALAGPGHVDGGDILVMPEEILVGRSARTDTDGIAELRRLVADWGYRVREVATPPGVLHFKTDCSLLAPDIVLSTPLLAGGGCFGRSRVILTAEGESAAANAIRVNDVVLMAAGFPHTATRVRAAGLSVREVDNTEFAKLDGGMSCLSLRF